MKKFMKAIAFVTVMCMALSTVAFAATEGAVLADEKILDITVTGAGTDQVALMVVASNATDFSAPLYIDQKGAVSGEATFRAVLTNANVDAVDIYVGYATYANAGNTTPKQIGNDIEITEGVTEVTISNVDCTWDLYHDNSEGSTMEQSATGAVISFNFEAPEGVSSTQMGWEITYVDPTDNTKTVTKYSDAFDITAYSLGDVIESGSNVKLGLAFLNGSEKNELDPVTIVNIKARFLFVGDALASGSQYVFATDSEPNQ